MALTLPLTCNHGIVLCRVAGRAHFDFAVALGIDVDSLLGFLPLPWLLLRQVAD